MLKQIHKNIDDFIYHEMLTHPVLFTHLAPEKIALIGEDKAEGILIEALKHSQISQITCLGTHFKHPDDKRIQYVTSDLATWLTTCPDNSYDVIIQTTPGNEDFFNLNRILEPEGILIFPSSASLLDPESILALYQQLKKAGFHAFQTLNFAQPSHPTGSRLLIMAAKNPTFRLVKERDVFNRSFPTRYYNYDVHKAAMALPEFVNHLIS